MLANWITRLWKRCVSSRYGHRQRISRAEPQVRKLPLAYFKGGRPADVRCHTFVAWRWYRSNAGKFHVRWVDDECSNRDADETTCRYPQLISVDWVAFPGRSWNWILCHEVEFALGVARTRLPCETTRAAAVAAGPSHARWALANDARRLDPGPFDGRAGWGLRQRRGSENRRQYRPPGSPPMVPTP
jgi:hypothetical protein